MNSVQQIQNPLPTLNPANLLNFSVETCGNAEPTAVEKA